MFVVRTMTAAEFGDVLRWLRSRWPDLNWPAETIAALQADLADISHDAAMMGCRDLYGQALGFPPSTSQLVAAATNAAHRLSRYRPALPEPAADRITGAEYRERFHGGASWTEILTGTETA